MLPLSIVLLLVLSAAVSLTVALYVATARDSAPGAGALVAMLLGVSLWSSAYLLQLQAPTIPEKLWWARFVATGTAAAVFAYLVFVLRYTERNQWVTPRRLPLLGAIPAMTTVAAWTNHVTGLVWQSPRLYAIGGLELLATTKGPVFLLTVVYGFVVVLVGLALIGLLAHHADRMYRGQATTVLAATVIPFVGSVFFYSLPRRVVPFDPTPLLFSTTALIVAFALYRYHMFDLIPVAPATMIEELDDAVVVLDRTDRISHQNPAAKTHLGLTDDAVGQQAAEVLPGWREIADEPRETVSHHELEITVDGTEHVFDHTDSPLYDYRDRFLGRQLVFRDVTERTQYERTLEQYRTAFETVSDAVYVVDGEGTFRLVNRSFADLVGLSTGELQGLHASDVLGETTYEEAQHRLDAVTAATEGTQPRDAETDMAAGTLPDGGGSGASVTLEFQLETATGAVIPCESQLSLLPSSGDQYSWAGIVRDISERKRVQRSLAETTSTLETVFEASPLAVITIDTGSRVTRWNPAAAEMLGWTESAMLGEHLPDHTGEGNRVAECCEHVLDGDIVTNEEVRWQTESGLTRNVSVSAAPLTDQSDSVTGAVLIAADITDRKHREQQLDVLSRILRHNLRNDMSVILPQAEMLGEDLPADRRSELAANVVERSRRLVRYASKARQAERVVDTGTAREEFAVDALLERTLAIARRRHPKASFSVAVELSATVLAQETLDVAVQNLLDNAVEHNDADSPAVTISVTSASPETVRIDVADNGPGIPESEREVLVDGEETPLHHGSGIGLWLVNWIVDRSGGSLSFSENDPRGSVVSLVLSRSKSVTQPTPQA